MYTGDGYAVRLYHILPIELVLKTAIGQTQAHQIIAAAQEH